MSAVPWGDVLAPPVAVGPGRRGHLSLVQAPARVPRRRSRLTRRGRLALTMTLLVLVGAVALVAVRAAGDGVAGGHGLVVDHSVTVEPGQTLSEIALAELPQLPTDVGVTRIQLLNELSTPQVRSGEVLLIPAA